MIEPARRRYSPCRPSVPRASERIMFVVSDRAGKSVAGDPIVRSDGSNLLDHDLDEVLEVLAPFLAKEGFAS